MSRKRMLIFVGLLVIVYSGAALYRRQQLRNNLNDLVSAKEAITAGRLKTAQSMLRAAELNRVGDSPFLPAFEGLRQEVASLQTKLDREFEERLQSFQKLVNEMVVLLDQGKSTAAYDLALAEQKKSGDFRLQPLVDFAERLKLQDFSKTADILPKLDVEAPPELMVGELRRQLSAAAEKNKTANHARQKQIAQEVKSLIGGYSQSSTEFRPEIRGRVMVWDFTAHEVGLAYELLRDDLRASATDNSVTVFCVMSRNQIVKGYYSVSNQPGYQEQMTIGVVYWPSRRGLGSVEIWGDPPRQQRPVSYSPEYASAVRIKDWIETLPRSGATLGQRR